MRNSLGKRVQWHHNDNIKDAVRLEMNTQTKITARKLNAFGKIRGEELLYLSTSHSHVQVSAEGCSDGILWRCSHSSLCVNTSCSLPKMYILPGSTSTCPCLIWGAGGNSRPRCRERKSIKMWPCVWGGTCATAQLQKPPRSFLLPRTTPPNNCAYLNLTEPRGAAPAWGAASYTAC